MKARNYTVYGQQDQLKVLQEEYVSIGRETRLEKDRLTVFALPQQKPVVEKKKSYRKPEYSSDER